MAYTITAAQQIDPLLTGLFDERVQDRMRFFKALSFMPRLPTAGLTAQFITTNDRPGINLDETDTAWGDVARNALPLNASLPEHNRNFTTGSVDLSRYGRKHFIADRIERHYEASGGFSVRQAAVNDLAEWMLTEMELQVMNTLLSTSGNYGTTSDPGDYSVTKTLDFVDDVNTGIRTVENAIGQSPTHFICNAGVMHELLTLNDVKERGFANAGTNTTIPNEAVFAAYVREMFGMELVVTRASYEVAGGTRSYTMGDHIALCFFSNVPTDPSFGHLFHETGEGFNDQTVAAITEYRSDDPKGTYVCADAAWVVSQAAGNTGAGYLLTDVLS